MIKVKQVPPDKQVSHFDFYEEPYQMALNGNRHMKDFVCDSFDIVSKFMDEFTYDGDDSVMMDVLNNSMPREVTENEGKQIWRQLKLFIEYKIGRTDAISNILSILDKSDWAYCTITGCCQGDWQILYYDTSVYNKEDVDHIEKEYFNLGTEWEIIEEDGFNFYHYSVKDSLDDVKKEICESFGFNENNVEFSKFVGYITTEGYETF